MNSEREPGNSTDQSVEWDSYVFKRSLPLQMRVHEIKRAIGSSENLVCMDVGSPNCMVSYYLRQDGGEWYTAVESGKGGRFTEALDRNVHEIHDQSLPFENKMFDIVVVNNYLERVQDVESFVGECHRVLKPDGRLIVHAAHAKRGGLIRLLDKTLGLSAERRGRARMGFTESELFHILKTGFDVHWVRSYSRFFTALVEDVVAFGDIRSRRGGSQERPERLHRVAGLCYRIAFQLDFLLFLTRGYCLIANAKRRSWRPREAPVLSDGRSIAEAVVSKAAR